MLGFLCGRFLLWLLSWIFRGCIYWLQIWLLRCFIIRLDLSNLGQGSLPSQVAGAWSYSILRIEPSIAISSFSQFFFSNLSPIFSTLINSCPLNRLFLVQERADEDFIRIILNYFVFIKPQVAVVSYTHVYIFCFVGHRKVIFNTAIHVFKFSDASLF